MFKPAANRSILEFPSCGYRSFSGERMGYRTGGHIIQPRRPVLRSRSRWPWPVVTYRLLWSASPKQQLVGPSTPTGMG